MDARTKRGKLLRGFLIVAVVNSSICLRSEAREEQGELADIVSRTEMKWRLEKIRIRNEIESEISHLRRPHQIVEPPRSLQKKSKWQPKWLSKHLSLNKAKEALYDQRELDSWTQGFWGHFNKHKPPTAQPTSDDKGVSTTAPVAQPTTQPTKIPTNRPTVHLSSIPSNAPSESSKPTMSPSNVPSESLFPSFSNGPSSSPSMDPTFSQYPTTGPSNVPSNEPTFTPSQAPSQSSEPTCSISSAPSKSLMPSISNNPSFVPSSIPTSSQTPTLNPSNAQSNMPSTLPSNAPSDFPSEIPSSEPTTYQSSAPSESQPSNMPSSNPTSSQAPTPNPSGVPSQVPSNQLSFHPSGNPSYRPSIDQSNAPSSTPTNSPSNQSSVHPSGAPSASPTPNPTKKPTTMPSTSPSQKPTLAPHPSSTGRPTQIPPASSFDLYAWGYQNKFGVDAYSITVPISMDESVVDVSAGFRYAMILLPDGTARSAGHYYDLDDYYGEMGVLGVVEGTNPFQDISQVFDAETGTTVDAPPFKRVFAGWQHSGLIDTDGRVWMTGENWDGELCLGDIEDRMIPYRVPIEGRIIDVAIGVGHTFLLHENGTVFGCGSNGSGRLGLGDIWSVRTPTKIEGLGFVESVSTSFGHTLFLSTSRLYVSGWNFFNYSYSDTVFSGQLCVDTGGDDVLTPLALSDINRDEVVSFKAGWSSSYILFKNGTVVACGDNEVGQLGDGTNEDKIRTTTLTPTPIKKLGVGPIADSVFFIDHNGVVYAAGDNSVGELGVGDWNDKNVPTVVQFGDDIDVQHISAGHSHTLAMVNSKSN